MPTNERFVSATPQGWSVDSRGYIHGGFDTPVFLEAKRRFNSSKTRRKRDSKPVTIIRAVTMIDPDGTKRKYVQPFATYGDPGFNRPATKDSNA